MLQPPGFGLTPYTTPSDDVEQGLGCLHAHTLSMLFRAELSLGLVTETAKKRDEFEKLRASQMRRRGQQHGQTGRSRGTLSTTGRGGGGGGSAPTGDSARVKLALAGGVVYVGRVGGPHGQGKPHGAGRPTVEVRLTCDNPDVAAGVAESLILPWLM